MSDDEEAIRRLVALWHRATGTGEVDTVGLMARMSSSSLPANPP